MQVEVNKQIEGWTVANVAQELVEMAYEHEQQTERLLQRVA